MCDDMPILMYLYTYIILLVCLPKNKHIKKAIILDRTNNRYFLQSKIKKLLLYLFVVAFLLTYDA